MNKFILTLAAVSGLLAQDARADLQRMFRDLKLPSQAQVERQLVRQVLTSGQSILSSGAGNTDTAAVVVSSGFTAQPDVARNLVITPSGDINGVSNCVISVAGTDYFGNSISEPFVFTQNQSAAVTGNKAFKTVTSITWPASCEKNTFAAGWAVTSGNKIGLKNCMDNAGDFFQAEAGGVYESTRPTIASHPTVVASNTAVFNSAPNGSRDYIMFFFQNYRCLR